MSVCYYCHEESPSDPYITVLNNDLEDFPPLFIQCGSSEILLDDALRLKEKAEVAGVQVKLEVWDEMWHVFQISINKIPEAKESLELTKDFIDALNF